MKTNLIALLGLSTFAFFADSSAATPDVRKWKTAVAVESHGSGDASSPQIAMDGLGNAVAVWHQMQPDLCTTGIPCFGIWAARYTPGSSVFANSWTAAAQIETDNTGDAFLPRVAFDTNGNATAVWYQFDGQPDVQHFTIRANRYAGPDAFGHFAYVPNGHLIGISPSGKFACVPNNQANTVTAFAIDAVTGDLIAAGSPVAGGRNPYAIAIDSSEHFAYVANRASSDVSTYAINQATGALSAVTGSPTAAGTNPEDIRIDPSGLFVYETNFSSREVITFAIDPLTGALTRQSAVQVGANDSNPFFIRILPGAAPGTAR